MLLITGELRLMFPMNCKMMCTDIPYRLRVSIRREESGIHVAFTNWCMLKACSGNTVSAFASKSVVLPPFQKCFVFQISTLLYMDIVNRYVQDGHITSTHVNILIVKMACDMAFWSDITLKSGFTHTIALHYASYIAEHVDNYVNQQECIVIHFKREYTACMLS